jgi:hypothetical protein
MDRKTAIYFHIGISVLIVLGSPMLFMMSIFALAGGANALSMGNRDGLGLIFIGVLPAYPVILNIWGWIVIAMRKKHSWWILLYSFLVCLALFAYFAISLSK